MLNNCLFSQNKGNYSVITNGGIAIIINCLFTGNNSNFGTIYNYKLSSSDLLTISLTIINSTIVDNVGGAIYNKQVLNLYNSILSYNNATQDIYNGSNGVINSANNLLGTSNINVSGNGNMFNIDPLFVGNGDYSLQSISPAIDAGDTSYLPDSILTDLVGNLRISGSSIDIGTFEYQKVSAVTNSSIQNKHKIYSFNRCVFIENNTDKVYIYGITGQLISSGYGFSFPVANEGVYLVKVDDTVQKVVVK